jgi:hypothetical protein
MIDPDLVATERAALLASWLLAGERVTGQMVAERFCISYRGALYLLGKVARALGECTEEDGWWFIADSSTE